MSKMFQTAMVLSVLVFAGIASAADNAFRVNVPFAFTVGNQQFAAGTYLVQQTNSGVVLITGEGRGAAVLSVPKDLTTPGVSTGLVFTNSHLTAVQVDGDGTRAIPMHASEDHKLVLGQ